MIATPLKSSSGKNTRSWMRKALPFISDCSGDDILDSRIDQVWWFMGGSVGVEEACSSEELTAG
jgi:hypothetical protein